MATITHSRLRDRAAFGHQCEGHCPEIAGPDCWPEGQNGTSHGKIRRLGTLREQIPTLQFPTLVETSEVVGGTWRSEGTKPQRPTRYLGDMEEVLLGPPWSTQVALSVRPTS